MRLQQIELESAVASRGRAVTASSMNGILAFSAGTLALPSGVPW